MLYTFFGTRCQLGEQELKKFGGEIELNDDEVKAAVLGGATLIPKNDFDETAFTKDMLKNRRGRRGDQYQRKFHCALDKLSTFRAALEAGTYGKVTQVAEPVNKVGVKLAGKK